MHFRSGYSIVILFDSAARCIDHLFIPSDYYPGRRRLPPLQEGVEHGLFPEEHFIEICICLIIIIKIIIKADYVLSIIDAYVDAQLFDFDISPNLSLNVQPQLNYDPWRDNRSAELKLALNF